MSPHLWYKNITFCDIPLKSILLFYNLSEICWSLTLIMTAYSCKNSLVIIKRNWQHKLRQKAILNLSFRVQTTRRKISFPGIHCRPPFCTIICLCDFSPLFSLPWESKLRPQAYSQQSY